VTIKLKNSGTVDFTDVNATDPVLGEIMSGGTIGAGETVTIERELVITEDQNLQLSVTAQDATGEPVETASGVVKVISADPTKQIALSLYAEPDKTEVYAVPGVIRFKVTVTNDSTVEVENVNVKAVDVLLNTFESIPAGESRSFTRDVMISMEGTYQFVASCKDQLGQTASFSGNPVQIRHTAPTPVPTEAPIVTPPAPVYATDPVEDGLGLDQLEQLANDAKWILAGVSAFLVLILTIGIVRRLIAKGKSAAAMDHMERGGYRDYSQAPRGKRNEVQGISGMDDLPEAIPETEGTVQDSELMAETLKKLYSKDKTETTAEAANAMAPVTEPEPVQAEQPTAPEQAAAETEAETAPKAAEKKAPEAPQNANDYARKRRKK